MKTTLIIMCLFIYISINSQTTITNKYCNLNLRDTNVLFNSNWAFIDRFQKLSNKINLTKYDNISLDNLTIYQFNKAGITIKGRNKKNEFIDLNFYIEEEDPNCFSYNSKQLSIIENCEWSPMLIYEEYLIVNIYCCLYKKRLDRKNICNYNYVETRIFKKV